MGDEMLVRAQRLQDCRTQLRTAVREAFTRAVELYGRGDELPTGEGSIVRRADGGAAYLQETELPRRLAPEAVEAALKAWVLQETHAALRVCSCGEVAGP